MVTGKNPYASPFTALYGLASSTSTRLFSVLDSLTPLPLPKSLLKRMTCLQTDYE